MISKGLEAQLIGQEVSTLIAGDVGSGGRSRGRTVTALPGGELARPRSRTIVHRNRSAGGIDHGAGSRGVTKTGFCRGSRVSICSADSSRVVPGVVSRRK